MKKVYAILGLIIVATASRQAHAETNLGITLAQGENGHPIVVEVTPMVGKFVTLGAYLKLQPGDEIITAHSDPITLPNGQTVQAWNIKSIANLRWVLARTNSRVGLTVKRNGTLIKAVAVYGQVQEMVTTSRGLVTVTRRAWHLEVDDPD